jgi:alkanesulfonate monooxygenase SsuD/methylene tetrahydromethanopterin reductase-like flavin-dependent oxidoreductase (luciferase family)
MKIDVFAEMQQPREIWGDGDNEHRLIEETLEQARLADEAGYGCMWLVEHHGAREFSYSSAPELMLTAIAQHTKRMRIGHGAVLGLHRINHPIRIAERAAMLDHLSGGRLELGLTRSGVPEWRLFGVEPEQARGQLQETYEMLTRIWTEERFSWKSDSFDIRDVMIVPKPLQKPHPPLWQAGVSPPAFAQAGRNGVGVLATTMLASIESVAKLVDLYRASIRACERPVGKEVNNQVANFTFVHCAESSREARENACASAVAWYIRTAGAFFEAKEFIKHMVAESTAAAASVADGGLAGKFVRENANAEVPRAQALIGRLMVGETVPEDEMFETLIEEHSIIVGTPAECRKKVKTYQEMGIDRLMCLHQVGSIRHEKIMKSMRLFSELIPEFDRT